MRTIKFRLWDIEDKKMLTEDFDDLTISLVGTIVSHEYGDSYDVSDKYKLMQYTGLKDKNGKEIYEGDVIESGHRVVFAHGCFALTKYGGAGTIILKFSEMEPIKVIGHIYENPELIS